MKRLIMLVSCLLLVLPSFVVAKTVYDINLPETATVGKSGPADLSWSRPY